MANYHMSVMNISRGKGASITDRASYIGGLKLYDAYEGKTCCHERSDVEYFKVYLPYGAPAAFNNPQVFCEEVDRAEKRRDSRTAREFVGSLPNELDKGELIRIVDQFVIPNFSRYGIPVMVAIHEGRNPENPEKNNPHVHILAATRRLEPSGFVQKKDRTRDSKQFIYLVRERWAKVQNLAYERNCLPCRVDHRSNRDRGINKEPLTRLSYPDWEREKHGEHTLAGDQNRAVKQRNEERERQERDREPGLSRFR